MRKTIDILIKKLSLKLYVKLLLKRSIKEAKVRWIKTGKRHYVMAAGNNFIVVNNSIVKKINKNKRRKWTIEDILNSSVYVTPNSTYHNI